MIQTLIENTKTWLKAFPKIKTFNGLSSAVLLGSKARVFFYDIHPLGTGTNDPRVLGHEIQADWWSSGQEWRKAKTRTLAMSWRTLLWGIRFCTCRLSPKFTRQRFHFFGHLRVEVLEELLEHFCGHVFQPDDPDSVLLGVVVEQHSG